MHMSIDVKCFNGIQLARSFHFVARFLYELGLFSSFTCLLASSSCYLTALMTLYTLTSFDLKKSKCLIDQWRVIDLLNAYSRHRTPSTIKSILFLFFTTRFMAKIDKTQLYSILPKFCSSSIKVLIDRFIMGRIFLCSQKEMGRMNYPVEIKVGRILFKMGRISCDIQPLFQALYVTPFW